MICVTCPHEWAVFLCRWRAEDQLPCGQMRACNTGARAWVSFLKLTGRNKTCRLRGETSVFVSPPRKERLCPGRRFRRHFLQGWCSPQEITADTARILNRQAAFLKSPQCCLPGAWRFIWLQARKARFCEKCPVYLNQPCLLFSPFLVCSAFGHIDIRPVFHHIFHEITPCVE